MAGKNNKQGRGTGGTVSSAPPKPSAMKVNLFQQASRDAQQRAGRMDQRIQSRGNQVRAASAMAGVANAKRRLSGKARLAYKKAYAGQGTVAFARDQRSGRVNSDRMAYAREARIAQGPTSGQYRAPATRLY